MHADASNAERAVLEPIIFTKAVDYRRDVKQNKISAENQAHTGTLLFDYNARVTSHTKRAKRKAQ
jgi:hypothetical protein